MGSFGPIVSQANSFEQWATACYRNHNRLCVAEAEMLKILIDEAGMSDEDAKALVTRFGDIIRGQFAELFT